MVILTEDQIGPNDRDSPGAESAWPTSRTMFSESSPSMSERLLVTFAVEPFHCAFVGCSLSPSLASKGVVNPGMIWETVGENCVENGLEASPSCNGGLETQSCVDSL